MTGRVAQEFRYKLVRGSRVFKKTLGMGSEQIISLFVYAENAHGKTIGIDVGSIAAPFPWNQLNKIRKSRVSPRGLPSQAVF